MSLRADIPDKWVDVNGLKVRYFEHGEGPPLLALHGMNYYQRADHWLSSIDTFSKIRHVYALDLPGWGYTDFPEGATDYFPLWVETVRKFCDAMGLEEMDILSYSIGGWVATLFTHQHSERVRRLVLLNTPGLNARSGSTPNMTNPSREVLRGRLDGELGRENVTEARLDEFVRELDDPARKAKHLAVTEYVWTPSVREKFSLKHHLPEIELPILVCQVDSARAVPVETVIEQYHLAPYARLNIRYGGSQNDFGLMTPENEQAVVDFLTTPEVLRIK